MGDRLATIDMGRKLGAAVHILGGGAGSTFNTVRPGPRPTFVPNGILIHPALWSQQTRAENWGRLCPFIGEGSWVPSSRLVTMRCTLPGQGIGDLGVPSDIDSNSDAREMFSPSKSTRYS